MRWLKCQKLNPQVGRSPDSCLFCIHCFTMLVHLICKWTLGTMPSGNKVEIRGFVGFFPQCYKVWKTEVSSCHRKYSVNTVQVKGSSLGMCHCLLCQKRNVSAEWTEHGLECAGSGDYAVKSPWSPQNVHWRNYQEAVSQQEVWKIALAVFWRSEHPVPMA